MQHPTDLGNLVEEFSALAGIQESEVGGGEDMKLQLVSRTTGNGDEADQLAIAASSRPLCDVRADRDRGSPHLAH